MNNPFRVFKIKREERWLAVIALLLFTALNALTVGSHWADYTKPLPHGGSWTLFTSHFEMSGYDCWSWLTLTEGRVDFKTIRHPLYLTILYPLYWLDTWLMSLTGMNLATLMIALLIVVSATYAAVFFFRICRDLLSLSLSDAYLLTALLFSFGHVMVPCMVPDHFAITLCLLLMTLYIMGKKMEKGRTAGAWQGFLLALCCGGVSASNVTKVWIAALFANGKRLFQPKFLSIAIALPIAVLLTVRQIQYYTIERPLKEKNEKVVKANKERFKSITIREAKSQQWKNQHDMKKAGDSPLLQLFDFSTPRLETLTDNYFGEGFQLHEDHCLEDELIHRPEFISYHFWGNYAMEAVIVLLFIGGMVFGVRHKLYLLTLSWWALDFTLNILLGFGINEVYIMTSGWAFIIPIGLGYLLKSISGKRLTATKAIVLFTALFLWTWNLRLIAGHLLSL